MAMDGGLAVTLAKAIAFLAWLALQLAITSIRFSELEAPALGENDFYLCIHLLILMS